MVFASGLIGVVGISDCIDCFAVLVLSLKPDQVVTTTFWDTLKFHKTNLILLIPDISLIFVGRCGVRMWRGLVSPAVEAE